MIKPYSVSSKDIVVATDQSPDPEGCMKLIAFMAMVSTTIASVIIIINHLVSIGATNKKEEIVVIKKEVVVPILEKEQFVRVFMHSPKRYSVFKMDESKKLEHFVFGSECSFRNFEFHCDVPDGEPMWLIKHGTENDWHRKVEFHIHSPKEINGGGWDEGKHGHGQTNVIE